MSELSARLNLVGAVDDAVRENPELLDLAAAVMPAYALGDDPVSESYNVRPTVGWFDEFVRMVDGFEKTGLGPAVEELTARRNPDELEQAHRLRALWPVARIARDQATLNTLGDVAAPLVIAATEPLPAPDPPDAPGPPQPDPPSEDRAYEVIEHLLDTERFPARENWAELVDHLESRRLISPMVAKLARIECHDRIVLAPITRPNGVEWEPAARIVTSVSGIPIGELTIAEVTTSVAPANWHQCMPTFWCRMDATDPPGPTPPPIVTWYQETVGDCPAVWFNPHLRFSTRDLGPNGVEVQYDMCDATDLSKLAKKAAADGRQPPTQDARVEVDMGVVRAEVELGAGANGENLLSIWTSKVIRLKEDLPTGGVAILACTSGWADQTRLMITGCLASP